MKVGDLLYYRPMSDDRFNEGCLGIAVAEIQEGSELKMKTLWFDDWTHSLEPMPGSGGYDEAQVGVLSESR